MRDSKILMGYVSFSLRFDSLAESRVNEILGDFKNSYLCYEDYLALGKSDKEKLELKTLFSFLQKYCQFKVRVSWGESSFELDIRESDTYEKLLLCSSKSELESLLEERSKLRTHLNPYLEAESLVHKGYIYQGYKEEILAKGSRKIKSGALDEVFEKRKSLYERTKSLNLTGLQELLDYVLLSSNGENLSYPSAGAIYESEVYLLLNIELEKSGLFHYDRKKLSREEIDIEQSDYDKLLNAPMLTCQKLKQVPQLVISIVANMSLLEEKYKNINDTLALQNASVLAQNFHLAACYLGYSCYINGYNYERKTLEKSIPSNNHHQIDIIFP